MGWIKKAYLYVVSLISLIILVIAAIMLINMGLKTWIFTKADNNYYPEYQCPVPVTFTPEKTPAPVACDPQEQARLQKQNKDGRTSQKQRDAAQAIAMILVASPVFYYHWKLARKEV